MIGKVDGDGSILTVGVQEAHGSFMETARSHGEDVVHQANQNLRLQELTSHQKDLLKLVKQILEGSIEELD